MLCGINGSPESNASHMNNVKPFENILKPMMPNLYQDWRGLGC